MTRPSIAIALVVGIASAPILASQEAAPVDSSATLERRVAAREYEASRNARGLQAPNRAHGLRSYFEPKGVRVVDRTASGSPALVSLSLVRLGRAGALAAVPPGEVSHAGPRVEIARPGLVEWYVNSPAGLEQGFTLAKRPEGAGPLVLDVTVAHARVTGSAERLVFRSDAGRKLSFHKLHVEDAQGAAQPARFALTEGGYRIVVEDVGATYPLLVDPLLTESFDTEIESNQLVAVLGRSVARAGDVNGDGFADVIVGAPGFDNGESDEGAAFVFLGSASGLADGNPINAATVLESNQADADLGAWVASAGDVNGDGYDDVIVGVPNYDSGQTNEGAALIFHGSAAGIPDGNALTADSRLTSNQANAFFGNRVASAGDVNGDGYADVIVGAPSYDNGQTDEGVAFLFHGRAGGIPHYTPANADGWLESNQASAFLGGCVAGAGDVDADGYADVIVGAGGYDNGQTNEGVALVFLGSAAGIGNGSPANAHALIERDDSQGIFDSAIACAGAGDVNGDGYADVIAGFDNHDSPASNGGIVLVFHGSVAGISGGNGFDADALLWLFQNGALLGGSVASAGDVNGDGYADVILGARGYDLPAMDEGAAFVLLGGATGIATGDVGLSPVWAELTLGQGAAELGTSVASAGDVNGDGFDDVIVGAPLYDGPQGNEGQAFVFLGGAGGIDDGDPLIAHAQLESDQTGAFFGESVASAGDVNGDGFGDLIVGAEGFDAGETNEGAAFVFLGSAAGVVGSHPGNVHAQLESDQAGALFGRSVASAGDVNGDGYADVIVGAHGFDAGETNEGAAFVFLGSAAGLADADPGGAHAQLESDQAGAFFGESVASAGDVNGDGFADVIVGAYNFDSGEPGEGAAFVFLGSAAGLPDADPVGAHAQLESNQADASFGESVASAGDVNGDGFADVIVGAYLFDAGEPGEGAAFVFLGSGAGLPDANATTAHARLESDQAFSRLGWSVASAGDVNGDGFADVIVGARLFDAGEPDEGAAFVFLGSAAGLPDADPAGAHAQLESDQSFAFFGESVASAGDVNGDGYADVIVGAHVFDAGETNEGAAFVFLGSAAGLPDADPTGAHAQLVSSQAIAGFGASVASAGDVNGDGFGDVIVGAADFDAGEPNEGAAFVFHGSPGSKGLAQPRQLRGDGSAPVQPWGSSVSTDAFRVQLTAFESPRGRERGKLEVEVCAAGTPFLDPGCVVQRSPTWVDLSLAPGGTLFEETISGLTEGELYRWRARVLYAPFTVTQPGIAPPPNPRGGPWRRVSGQAVEADVRVLPEPGAFGLVAGALLLAMSLAARERRTLPIGLLASPLAFLCLAALPAMAFPAPGELILTQSGAVLTLDPATGDRTELSGSSTGSGVAFSLRPIDVVREQSGDFVVADFDVQALIRVDGATGDRSVLASSVVGSGGPFRPGALEIDGDLWIDPANDGTLLVWNSNASAIERVDPVSGDRTVIASASIGPGPNLSAVQDMLRFGPGLFSLDDALLDLMVTDSNLGALLLVSTYTGERVVVSSASVGSGTGFVTPRGIAMVPPPTSNANDLPVFYVVDSGLDAIVGVHLVFASPEYVGDRQIVSSASIGGGPDFDFPYNIWPSPDGGLYVSDLGLDAIFHVDPATGDRTIVSDAVTGVGPALSGVWSFTAVPEPALAWGFEAETPGQPPAFTVPFPDLLAGTVTVERAVDFTGSVLAAEGERVLYLTTGPGFRGDPAIVAGQFDESFLALPVYRGQNAPRRLRLSVDYLTDEGAEPDPTDVVALQTGSLMNSTPLALLSMQAVNPSPSPFVGGSYSALTGFADGPIVGPDGSSFGEGHVGYLTYELEVDFPGAGLILRVADQGDGDNDSALLVDDIRFVPEPGLAASVAAGGLLVASLRRRRGRRADVTP